VLIIGCEVEPVEIVRNIGFLMNGTDLTGLFGDEFAEKVTNICGGGGDLTDVVTRLNASVNGILCSLANAGVSIRKFFQCSTWYPLYQSVLQNTVCYSAIPAFTWIAVTQFIILMLTMVIMTCRVVLWDLAPEEEEEEAAAAPVEEENVVDAVAPNNGEELMAEASSPEKDETGELTAEIDDVREIEQPVSAEA
jgi:hypothetical protein